MSTEQQLYDFVTSPQAASLSDEDFSNQIREIRKPPTPPDVMDGEDVSPEPEPDTRPVSGRGEGRAAFQTPKGPDSVFSPEFEPGQNEEEASKALASGVLATLDSWRGIADIPAKLRGEEVPLRFSEAFDIDPIELDTKWGPFLESTVHYGSLGLGVMAAISASPFTLPTLGGGASFLSKFGTGVLQGSIIGVAQDAISYRSFEQNASRMIIDNFSQFERILGPLATKDSDNPLTIYLKNILEGVGTEATLGLSLIHI